MEEVKLEAHVESFEVVKYLMKFVLFVRSTDLLFANFVNFCLDFQSEMQFVFHVKYVYELIELIL